LDFKHTDPNDVERTIGSEALANVSMFTPMLEGIFGSAIGIGRDSVFAIVASNLEAV
jgi:hypothetical protein